MRLVRFALPLDGSSPATHLARHNTFAAWPPMVGIGLFVELAVDCAGTYDPQTGYVADIRTIDDAVRDHVVPCLASLIADQPGIEPAAALSAMFNVLDDARALEGLLRGLTWHLSPFYHVAVTTDDRDSFLMRIRFDFAAAHYLRCRGADEETSRAVYGRCAHPHGHNYRLEVAARVPIPKSDERAALTNTDLEGLVRAHVLDVFDHADLNHDLPEFANEPPSVERIAIACHGRLVEAIARSGGSLVEVTVWETDKTACTYPGG